MEKLGKPVIFHTGLLMEGLPGLLRQVQPLNIDDVASKFPKLKIIMAHFGNPWITDAAAVLFRNKNVYVDLSGYFEIFKPIPKKDIKYLIQDITFIKNWVGLKRCLFGTDWPLYSQEEYLAAVKQIPMNTEEKELVLWKNARELFKLDI
jgi:predicted TIM-barrel fold metal-dependent hydrolase